MKIAKYYSEKIDELMGGRGLTKFHITGIRHCDYSEKAEDFIREAAQKYRDVILMPEEANLYDPEAVVCYSGNKQVGYVSTYDMEKYYILAEKNDADHLIGHFFFGNTGDHLLELSVMGTITLDDIYDYRKEIDKQKDVQYGSWRHDAIKRTLVHSRHQNDAKACISQMKDAILKLFFGYGFSTRDELLPLLEQYKESSQYDISLEGQRDRWDILLYLDYLYDAHHRPGHFRDEFFENMLTTVTDVCSQIGGELVRSVSYTDYVERLKGLFTKRLPSSEAAQYYLNTKPDEVFCEIRQQIQNFPHHLYHLFHTNPEEFVRTIYYARIPRKYLDPFLSGIALVEAYDNNRKVGRLIETPVSEQKEENPPELLPSRKKILNRLMDYASKGNWANGITDEDIKLMLKRVLGATEVELTGEYKQMSNELWRRLEHGREGKSNRVDIVWANFVGYFKGKKFFQTSNSAQLSRDFYGNTDQTDNINKGNNGRMEKVKKLLDAYLPQVPPKT